MRLVSRIFLKATCNAFEHAVPKLEELGRCRALTLQTIQFSVTRYVDDVVSLSLCARVRNPALEPARGSASQSGGGGLAEKRDR